MDVPSACGATRMEKDPPRLLADLGPADRLTVRWQEGVAASGAGPAVDVEQFVVAEGAARFRGHRGEVQAARAGGSSSAGAIWPSIRGCGCCPCRATTRRACRRARDGQSRLITFRWPHPVPDQVTLDATFLLSGTLGVGNFRLPQIEVLDARPTQRWLAVSVDPAWIAKNNRSSNSKR